MRLLLDFIPLQQQLLGNKKMKMKQSFGVFISSIGIFSILKWVNELSITNYDKGFLFGNIILIIIGIIIYFKTTLSNKS